MSLESFDATIDSAEIDHRPRVKAVVAKIVATEFAGVPVELAARIAKPRLETLGQSCKDAIESGRYEALDGLLSGFRADCRAAVILEKQSGQLKSWSAIDACRPFVGIFSKMCFNGFEVSHGQQLLPPNSHLVEITYREWILDQGRRITREQIKQQARDSRPAWTRTVGNAEEFERNFTSEVKIREAEAAAARRESKRHEISSGPAHLIGTSAK